MKVKNFQILILVVLLGLNSVKAQVKSPAQQLSNYVDPFTGDFRYNIPLLTLSGPNGEKFPLALNYSGGVRANQAASWVGLGWSLNIGQISRQVKGMPDDYNNANHKKDEISSSTTSWSNSESNSYFGPLYFDEIYGATAVAGNKKLDMYKTSKDLSVNASLPFTFPDFDSYHVSGPGVSGEMRPFLFDFAEIPAYPNYSIEGSYTHQNTAAAAGESETMREFSKKPVFRFTNEPMAELTSNLAQDDQYPYWSSYLTPDDMGNLPDPFFYNRFPDANGTNTNKWYNRNGDVDVYDAANYIEYYTNEQIYDHYEGVPADEIVGFLDFEEVTGTSDRNSATKYEADGIGAFKVTTPNGMTYHYSLPVYVLADTITTINISHWGSTINNLSRITNDTKYASSWKLTAITDYRYEDSNNNNYPDEGDKGFWIRVNYTKWSDDYMYKAPYYGYLPDAISSKNTVQNTSGEYYKSQGTISETNTELYYPESIQTATQTAYFIKDVRYDDHGVANASGYHTPKLFLKYIVLLDNDDVVDNSIFNSSQTVVETLYSGLSSVANTSNTLSVEDYDYYETDIENYALKTIEFDYDYHLNQKLYNNIKNTFTETDVKFGGGSPSTNVVYSDGLFSNTHGNDDDLSGKLTLNQLITYEQNHDQIVPPYQFDYVTNNPDFNHEQKDIYGYYKYNFDTGEKSRYLSDDHAKVDAWSLQKITTPMGAKIIVNYESDSYTAVGYDGEKGMAYKPSRVFYVNGVDFSNSTNTNVNFQKVTINDSDVDFYFDDALKKYLYIDYSLPAYCNNCSEYFTGAFDGTITTTSGVSNIVPNSSALCAGTNNCYSPTLGGGYLYLIMDEVYGGGTRVKDISIKDPLSNESYKLTYSYSDGLATTEPDAFSKLKGDKLQRNLGPGDRHALAPSVGYAKVRSYIGDLTDNIGSTEYIFRNMASISMVQVGPKIFTNTSGTPFDINYAHYVAQDNKSLYGRVESITNYDNTDNVVTKSTYEYHDYATDPRGLVDEVFYDYYKYHHPTLKSFVFKRLYWKQTINTHLKKETLFKDGIISTIEYEERDNFTGIPKRTKTVTPTLTSTKFTDFAYQSETYMGAKTTDTDYDNLLVPVQEERTSPNGGTSSEWENSLVTRNWNATSNKYETTSQTSIWAPTESSVYNGLSGSTWLWKKVSFNSLFSGKNGESIVERKDMQDKYTASKYGYENRYKIAEVNNCNYTSFAYSGFESDLEVETGVFHFDGEIEKGSGIQKGTVSTIEPHTGDYMVELNNSSEGPIFKAIVDNVTVSGEDFERGIQVGRTYIASVWVHKDSPNDARMVFELDGNQTDTKNIRRDSQDGIQIGDWIQLNIIFTVPSNYVSSGGTNNDVRIYLDNPGTRGKAYFDDLVIHPVDAQFAGYVYDERLGQVKYVISNDNFYTRFEHDNAGNTIATYKETQNGEKVITTTEYNFDQ